MPMPFFRAVWATVLVLGAAMRLVGQEKSVNTTPVDLPANVDLAPSEWPVVLEEFAVTAPRPGLESARWNYCRIDGFEILSSAPENVTRQLIDDFNRFVFALNLVSPQMRLQNPLPVTIVICGDAAHFRELTADASNTTRSRGALTLNLYGRDRSAIIVNAQSQLLRFPDGTAETAAAAERRWQALYSSRIRHDYMGFLLGRLQPAVPDWFKIGVTQIYASMRILDEEVTVGRAPAFVSQRPPSAPLSQRVGMPRLQPGDRHNLVPSNPTTSTARENSATRARIPTGGSPEEDFNSALADSSLLALEKLFSRKPSPSISTEYGRWANECEAFVHWGLHGDDGRHASQTIDFVERLRHEPPSEALFRECFQLSYADGLQALRTHIEFTRARYFGVRADTGKKLPRPDPAQVRAATPSEIARLKSEAHELAGRPTEARQELIRAYRRGERDPELLAQLGLSDLSAGETARARQFLEAAAVRQARQPRAYLALARLRFAEHLARRDTPSARLLPRQVKEVLEPVATALAVVPLADGYDLAAEVWLAAEEKPTAAQFRGLLSGVQLAPRDQDLIYHVATLAVDGDHESARALISLGLKHAATDSQRTRLEELARRLSATKA